MYLKFASLNLPKSAVAALSSCLLLSTLTSAQITPVPAKIRQENSTVLEPKSNLSAQFARIPLAFEKNSGQQDSQVEYLARGAGYTLFLTRNEAVLALGGGKASADVVRVRLAGTNFGASISALQRLSWDNNYFIGNDPSKWQTHVANFGKVQFDEIYPGIQLVYYGNQQQLEHDFIVSPGADPKKIAMEISGAKKILVDDRGNLVIKTQSGELRFEKPVLYQEVNGNRKEVAGNFVLRGKKVGFEVAAYDRSKALVIDPVLNYSTYLGGASTTNATSIALDGSLNAYVTGDTLSLSFPPSTRTTCASCGSPGATTNGYVASINPTGTALLYNTFFGGDNPTRGAVIAVDGSGNAFVGGPTLATNFPTTSGSFQPAPNASQQGFVIRLDATGNLTYGSYLGGTASTFISGLAVASGSMYVTGNTSATDFPTTSNAFQTTYPALTPKSAFLSRISPGSLSGLDLVYSTYVGGGGGAQGSVGHGVAAIDSSNVYLVGFTDSATFPVSAGAAQTSVVGPQDGFIAKFDTSPSFTVTSATCNSGGTTPNIAVITAANTVVPGETVTLSGINTGATESFSGQVTVLGGANAPSGAQFSYIGNCVAADSGGITAASRATGGRIYATYLGGAGIGDDARAVAVDSSRNVYVTGVTGSATFPKANALQPALAGANDAFITKLDATTTGVTAATCDGANTATITVAPAHTFISGSLVNVMGVPNGAVTTFNGGPITVLAGSTPTQFSYTAACPVADASTGPFNASAVGGGLVYSTYLGGSGIDAGNAIAVDPASGIAWVAGSTQDAAPGNTFFNINALQGTATDLSNGFIARINAGGAALEYSTYFGGLGGSDSTVVTGIAVDPATGAVYLSGDTASASLAHTSSAFQTAPVSASTGFVAKLAANAGAQPGFTLTVTPSTTNVGAGQPVTYIWHVVNANPATATTLNIPTPQNGSSVDLLTVNTGTLPAGCASRVGGAGTTGPGGVTCLLASPLGVPPTDVTISYTGSAALACGVGPCPTTSFNMNGSVASAEAPNASTNPATLAAPLTTNVLPVADIQMSAITAIGNASGAGKFVVQKDTSFTYQYTVTNAGPDTAPSITVTNNLPAGFSAATITATLTAGTSTSQTCPAAPQINTFTCSITSLSSGGAVQITLSGNPTSLLAAGTASTTNQLDFSASEAPTAASYIDNVSANDSATVIGSVLERDTTLTATLTDNGPVATNSAINFTATVNNGGPSNATNVQLDTTIAPTLNAISPPAPVGITCGAVTSNAFTCGGSGTTINAAATATVTTSSTAPATLTQPVVIDASPGGASRDAGGVVTITVTGGHPFATGQQVEIAGVTSVGGTQFNGRFTITGTTATTFTYSQAAALGTDTGGAGTAFVFGSQTIAASPAGAARVAGVVTITTSAPHGFAAGQTVQIAGVTSVGLTSFNGRFRIVSASGSTFTYDQKGVSDDTGGAGTATIFMGSQFFYSFASLNTNPPGTSDINTPALPIFADTNTEVQNQTDLSVTSITAAPPATPVLAANTVSMTGPLTYTVSLGNSAAIAPNTMVRFTLTTGTVITTDAVVTGFTVANSCVANPSGGTTTQTVDCLVDSLPIGASSITLSITPPVTTALSGGTVSDTLATTATVSSDFVIDGTPGNDSASLATPFTIQRTADLNVTGSTFTGAPNPVDLSGTLTYSLDVNNAGPDPAVAVHAVFTIAASSNITTGATVGVPTNATCTANAPVTNTQTIDCTLTSPIASAGTTTVTLPITGLLTNQLSTGATAIDPLQASATVSSTSIFDTNAGNETTDGLASRPPKVSTNLRRHADLNFVGTSFTNSPATVAISLPETLSLASVNNAGPDPAINVHVLFTITATSNIVTGATVGSPTNAACTANAPVTTTQTIDCTVTGAIASGAGTAITVPISGLVTTAMTGGAAATTDTVSVRAQVGSTAVVDTVPANDQTGSGGGTPANASYTIRRTADLDVTTTPMLSSPNPFVVTVNTNLTYTVTVQNNGPDTALNAVIVATLPTGFGFTGGTTVPTGCTFSAPTLTCASVASLASINNGSIGSLIITGQPGPITPASAASTTLAASATVSSPSTFDSVNTNNTTNNGTPEERQSDLGVAVAQSASIVNIGQAITYTLTVNNFGPSDATGVSIVNSLPSGFVPTGVVLGGSLAASGCTATGCSGLSLLNGSTGTIGITGSFPNAALAAGSAQDSTKQNTATISSTSVIDSNGANNSSSVTTTLQRTSDLGVVVTQSASTVNVTDPITYTLTVTNAGPNDATNVAIANTLPAGFVQSGVTLGGSLTASGCTATGCSGLSLTSGSSGTIAIAGSFPSAALGASASNNLNDSANISSSSVVDNNASNNSSSVTTSLQRTSDLGVVVTQSASTLNVTNPITYTLTVTNAGPSDATNVAIANILPAGFVQSGVTLGGSLTASGCTATGCSGLSLANGSVGTIAIAGSFPSAALGALSSTNLNDSVSISSNSVVDNNASNNTSSVTTTVQRTSDLGVVVTQSASTINVNAPITYTLTVTNAGPNDAINVAIANTLPAGFVQSGVTLGGSLAASGCTATGCSGLSLANGSSGTIAIAGSFPTGALGAAASNNLNDSATISSTSVVDTNSANNSSTATTTVQRSADLSIVTSQSPVSGIVSIGQTVTYTLTVSNAGPNDATNVTVSNVLPSGFVVSTAIGAGSLAACGSPITCTGLTLTAGAGGNGTLTITGSYPNAALAAGSPQDSTKQDSATIGSASIVDSNGSNNSSSVGTTLQRTSDLSIVVAQSAGTVNINAPITYTLTVANLGPNDATNVVIANSIPAGFVVTSATGAGSLAGCSSSSSCNVATLLAGASGNGTLTITGSFPNAALSNTATSDSTKQDSASITSATIIDLVPGNNSSSVLTTLQRSSDLQITMTSPTPAATLIVGPSFAQTIIYNIVATNNGPDDAPVVKVTDVLPVGFVLAAGSSPSCTGGSNTIVCDLTPGGGINSGSTVNLTIVATATPSALPVLVDTATVTNQASISSSSAIDTTSANNTSSPAISTTLHGEADINVVSIVGSPDPVLVGNTVTYVVTVNNIGPHPSQPLTFNNTWPAGVTPLTAVSPTFTCATASSCSVVTLGAGSTTTITLTGTVTAAAVPGPGLTQALSETATIATNTEDPAAANNTRTLNTSPIAEAAADLVLTQTSPAPVLFGQPVNFAVTVRNDNVPVRSTATGVVVTNTVTVLPANSASIVTGLTPGCTAPPFSGGTTTVTCTVGNLASNASTTVNFTVTPSVPGKVTNVSTVNPRGLPTTEVDPNLANNTTGTSTVIVDNTPVCNPPGACGLVIPIDTSTGVSPLAPPSTVRFTNVTAQGTTSIVLNPAAAIALPYRAGNYVPGSGPTHFYDMATTAAFTGNITVCIDVTGISFRKPERVRLIQINGGTTTDITASPGLSGTVICGVTSSLGRFAVAEPSNTNPVPAGSAALSSSGAGKGLTGSAVDLDANATFDVDQDPCFSGIGAPSCSDKGSSANAQLPDQLTYVWCSLSFSDGAPVATNINGANVSGQCPGLAHTFTAASNPSKQLTVSVSGSSNVSIILIVIDQIGGVGTKTFSVNLSGGTTGGGGGGGTGGTTGGGTTGPQTVSAGQAATFTTSLAASLAGGTVTVTGFTFQVTPAIADPTAQIVCVANPLTLTNAPSPATVTVICNTQGPIFAMSAPPRLGTGGSPMLAGMVGITALPLIGMILLPGRKRRTRTLKIWSSICLLLLLSTFQMACGGGGSGTGGGFGGAPKLQSAGTPKGVYTVLMTATPSGAITPNPLQLGCVTSGGAVASTANCTGQNSITVQ